MFLYIDARLAYNVLDLVDSWFQFSIFEYGRVATSRGRGHGVRTRAVGMWSHERSKRPTTAVNTSCIRHNLPGREWGSICATAFPKTSGTCPMTFSRLFTYFDLCGLLWGRVTLLFYEIIVI